MPTDERTEVLRFPILPWQAAERGILHKKTEFLKVFRRISYKKSHQKWFDLFDFHFDGILDFHFDGILDTAYLNLEVIHYQS